MVAIGLHPKNSPRKILWWRVHPSPSCKRFNMIVYDNDGKNIVISTTPRIEFDDRVPTWFINEFLRRMAKNQIKIKDYQGNELKVYYE